MSYFDRITKPLATGETIKKFNPNHGADGRFSSGKGGGGSSISSSSGDGHGGSHAQGGGSGGSVAASLTSAAPKPSKAVSFQDSAVTKLIADHKGKGGGDVDAAIVGGKLTVMRWTNASGQSWTPKSPRDQVPAGFAATHKLMVSPSKSGWKVHASRGVASTSKKVLTDAEAHGLVKGIYDHKP